MDSQDGKDKVTEEAPSEDSTTSAEPTVEGNTTLSSNGNNREVEHDTITQTPSESECSSSDRPQIRVSENTCVPAPPAVASSDTVQDCRISVPEGAYALPKRKKFSILGCLNPRDSVHGSVKPEDFNPVRERSSRQVAGRGVGDVTLNLTEFLSYAQRNHYDIVIPASRETRSLNTNLPRIGTGRGYMVLEQQHFPLSFGMTAAELVSSSADITHDTPPRNSVLAPTMYHPEDIRPPVVDFNAPPPYEMPIKLPTYEEVQREKALEGELVPPADIPNADTTGSSRTLSFLAIDTDMGTNADPESKLLGSDFMFAVAFILALVFNWIGFLLMMCFCHTVASRYGALSGFGLSLAKWTIIVKNSTEVPIHNAWLWWLITTFGLLICVRSLFQYINIKRGWRLMSAATQERLLFFY